MYDGSEMLTLYYRYFSFIDPKKVFENRVGKGENAGNQHFLLFPLCFLHHQKQIPYLSHI